MQREEEMRENESQMNNPKFASTSQQKHKTKLLSFLKRQKTKNAKIFFNPIFD